MLRSYATACVGVGLISHQTEIASISASPDSFHHTCFFPFLDQLHDITDIPKPLLKAASHGWGHTDGAVNTGKIIPASVERDHVNVIVDLLGMTRSQPRKPAHMLAHGLVMLFHNGRGNQRWLWAPISGRNV